MHHTQWTLPKYAKVMCLAICQTHWNQKWPIPQEPLGIGYQSGCSEALELSLPLPMWSTPLWTTTPPRAFSHQLPGRRHTMDYHGCRLQVVLHSHTAYSTCISGKEQDSWVGSFDTISGRAPQRILQILLYKPLVAIQRKACKYKCSWKQVAKWTASFDYSLVSETAWVCGFH